MPAGNGRGPMNNGPMTGRGAGYCAGYSAPGNTNLMRNGGFCGSVINGAGRRIRNQFCDAGMTFRGRGFRNCGMAGKAGVNFDETEFSAENELQALKKEMEFMQSESAAINERIKELESISAVNK